MTGTKFGELLAPLFNPYSVGPVFFPKQGCATSHFLNQDPCMDRLHLVRYIAVFRDLLLELSHLTSPPRRRRAQPVGGAGVAARQRVRRAPAEQRDVRQLRDVVPQKP